MKKLKKLQINSERLMKNEELITLKGGTNCICFRDDQGYRGPICATGSASSASECDYMCHAACATPWYTFGGY